MLSTGFVVADHADDVLTVLILRPRGLVVRALLGDRVTLGVALTAVEGSKGAPQGEHGGRGQQVGVPPDGGRWGHQGHVRHRGAGAGNGGGVRGQGGDPGEGLLLGTRRVENVEQCFLLR